MNLDEYTFHGGKLLKQRKTARTIDVSVHFSPEYADRFDSGFFLTRFAAVSSKPVQLNSVLGRLADFDTGFFDLYLAVLQFNNEDTLISTVPVRFDGRKRAKSQFALDLYGQGIVLRPGPFYIGYGFRVKSISRKYSYPFYVSMRGEGIYMLTRDGKTTYSIRDSWPNVFPFVITYIER